ncbi:hypothetical protein V2J09_018962 [Rumex salicifolius]
MEITSSTKNFYSVGNLTVIALCILGVFFIYSFPPKDSLLSRTSLPPVKKVEIDELEAVLEKAEINNTVIIAMVNKAYVEGDPVVNMLDLFLESFWLGEGTRPLINNLLIVATDRTAYERCLFRGLHCYLLADESDGSDLAGENVFMSKAFIKMMWRRTFFLLNVLRKGYNFIFTDTDVLWLRNPFTILNSNNTNYNDIQFSTDWFNGNPKSEKNSINTGFYFVRSTNGTMALFQKWYGTKDNATGIKEQDVLQKLVTGGALRELNVTASFLETRYFSGFCQDSKEMEKVVTVHANCCRYIRAKVDDLARVLQDWKRFNLGLPPVAIGNSTSAWSSHVSCRMSWKMGSFT